jgi:hypothetical protein
MRDGQKFAWIARGCLALVFVILWGAWGSRANQVRAQADDPSPPSQVVKLIFIHHSTGENWLGDGYGNLGAALGENNYFVSDTNYGWGPGSIGDRTDIPNWTEWFRSRNSSQYLAALYAESEQHSGYTRSLPDPGGENQIVMFKSCFPNSDLAGNPDDSPEKGWDLTVGNAKYIYNDLLEYFQTRPDKLFVVITAPPLQYPSQPENARAFNTWLVQDWLAENDYPLNNVAVFDFYNVLTHPDNHHRFANGQIEYITSHGANTLYYDSNGDDHPNPAGSQKATAEFVSLLNVYYHRWASGAPQAPPIQGSPTEAPPQADESPQGGEELPEAPAPLLPEGDLIDDFESGPPHGTWGWQPNWDESTSTTIACYDGGSPAYSGQGALYLQVDVAEESWATCSLGFEQARNWRDWSGLSFYVHAGQAGLPFDLNLYGGSVDSWETYLHTLETSPEMVTGWVRVEVPWEQLLRADWEANAGVPFDPGNAVGLAFGVDGNRSPRAGEIWVDELRLVGETAAPPAAEAPTQESAPPEEAPPESPEDSGGGGLPCTGALAWAAFVALSVFWRKQRHG